MKMSYDDFLNFVKRCSNAIDVNSFDYIVTPVRGGLVFTGYLVYLQNSKVPVITINHSAIPDHVQGNILVLDDINDTSKTFMSIRSASASLNRKIAFMPLLERYNSKIKTRCPNIINTDEYVYFPWDNVGE